jgi:protein-L-isoaspartate(D-aspartate) O-methyltransferase
MAPRILGAIASAVLAACTTAESLPQTDAAWAQRRAEMVARQLRARDITSPRVLDAMARVPRHLFVPVNERARAYADHPLPIGYGQTISQPYIVAFMTQAVDPSPTARVLEIGTGSGYQAAVLAELAGEIYSIEIVPELAERARTTLESLGYERVHVRTGDGYAGWPEHAPFDRIVVTAAPETIPPTLVDQLAVGGRMAIPVGRDLQQLQILEKTADGLRTLRTLPVRFVPMVRGDGR